jgi:hypothetical protein
VKHGKHGETIHHLTPATDILHPADKSHIVSVIKVTELSNDANGKQALTNGWPCGYKKQLTWGW